MMRRGGRTTSLATSVVLLTFVLAMVAVSIVGLSALVGVYDLASSHVSARHQAYLQALVGDIALRLDPAGRLVTQSIAVAVDAETGEVDRAALAAQFDTGIEYVDQLLFARRDGTVISGYPTFRTPRSVEGYPVLSNATTETPVYYYERLEDSADTRLWVARAVEGNDELVMLARVRSGFLRPFVDRFADPEIDRWVLLVEQDGTAVVMSVGASRLVQESIVYQEEQGAPNRGGTVSAVAEDEAVVWGHYADIEGYPGLPWRGVIVEPRAGVVMATLLALAPAVMALVASGVITLVLVGVLARRLVAPLTYLEERAREAVTGAYVRPLQSERTDEIGRLAAAFNAIALRLNALHDLSQLLASSSRLDQVLDGIMSAMGHIVRTATVAVFLVDEQSGTLALARARDLSSEGPEGVSLDSDSWLVEALHAEDPEVRFAFGADIARFVPGEYGQAVTVLTASLTVGTEPLGVVVVIEDGARTFSEAETEMVRTFSAQAAVAVYNSRLFEIETRSRTEAEVLRAVAEQLSRPQELAAALESVEETTAILLGASSTVLAVFDRAAFGLPSASHPLAEEALLAAWRESVDAAEPTAVVDSDSGDGAARLLASIAASRALLAAVMIDKEPCAILAFLRAGERPFTLREHRLAASLASQLSLAFESAYNFERARTRAVNLETIFRISQAVSSSLQTKVVLNRVLDVVQKIFAADAVSLMTYDAASGMVSTEMARGMVSSEMLHFETEPGVDVPGRVFSSGEPARAADVCEIKGGLATLAAEQGLHSMLSVPLLARGRSTGVLSVFSTERGAFSDEDMGLLHTFASQAALAIDTAKLYSKEHLVATVLQASILPKTLPEFPGIESSSVYLPAGVEADIGGDYYDLFRAPGGGIFMVMGDVCGKGVAAATKTSKIKYTVRGLAAAGLGPAEIISEVNQTVAQSGDTSDIVTLWIGALDVDAGTLSYANGGHPPALLRRAADSSILRFPPTGALLGATAGAHYDLETVQVGPGDLILLYTDGVTEARRGNTFFGEGRVQRALRQGRDAGDVTQRLLSSLDRFVPGAIRDDAAVLAVGIVGEYAGLAVTER
ncbi:MAG: SpoIIE family protein phosphatase [Coriobacteriia bacterium]|nr:SpoIIE family protein phosphatase [Coriobacteriia bacterium]